MMNSEEEAEGQLNFSFWQSDDEGDELTCETARSFAPDTGAGVVERNELMEPARPESVHSEAALEALCREWLCQLELPGAAKLVKVQWNARLRSTAGYASYPAWRIELNPKLKAFEGQVERTLKHELAHLIAYHRARRRRIDPHGEEWRSACASLGIAGEKACHQLPLPRAQQKRTLAYQCPACGFVLHRVRRFRRPTACMSCCTRHSQGRFDNRFQFRLKAGGVEQ